MVRGPLGSGGARGQLHAELQARGDGLVHDLLDHAQALHSGGLRGEQRGVRRVGRGGGNGRDLGNASARQSRAER